jgi:uncharacterized membrane protein YraQ (UPF0718 family)
MTSEKSYASWYFLIIVIFAYLAVFIYDSSKIVLALKQFIKILIDLIPVFILLILLTALINYYVNPQTLVKYLGEKSGVKGVLIAIVSGIISTGPIYMWYPLLNDLQQKGVKNSIISIFLYNRAIKIPLIPVVLEYFTIQYVIILTLTMIIISILQGYLLEQILKKLQKNDTKKSKNSNSI